MPQRKLEAPVRRNHPYCLVCSAGSETEIRTGQGKAAEAAAASPGKAARQAVAAPETPRSYRYRIVAPAAQSSWTKTVAARRWVASTYCRGCSSLIVAAGTLFAHPEGRLRGRQDSSSRLEARSCQCCSSGLRRNPLVRTLLARLQSGRQFAVDASSEAELEAERAWRKSAASEAAPQLA